MAGPVGDECSADRRHRPGGAVDVPASAARRLRVAGLLVARLRHGLRRLGDRAHGGGRELAFACALCRAS